VIETFELNAAWVLFILWSLKLSFLEMCGTFHVANVNSVSARH